GPGLDLELDEPCDLLLLRRHRLPDSSTGFRRRAVHPVGRLLVCTRPPALAPGADMRRHGRNLGEFTCNGCAILIRSQCHPRSPSDIWPARAGRGAGSSCGVGVSVDLLDLCEALLDRRLTAEDRDEHLELLRGRVDLGDTGGQRCERTVHDAVRLADL